MDILPQVSAFSFRLKLDLECFVFGSKKPVLGITTETLISPSPSPSTTPIHHQCLLVHALRPANHVYKHADVDTEDAAERRVEIGDDVAQQTDGDYGEHTDEEVTVVRVRLGEEDAEEGDETEQLQEQPPGRNGEEYLHLLSQCHTLPVPS